MDDRVGDEKLDKDALLVGKLVGWFEGFEHTTRAMCLQAKKRRDYYDGKQLSEAQIEALNKRKQPPVVYNVIKRKVDFLVGMEKQQRTDPKAYPRTPLHEQDAEAATDALRFIAEREDYDVKRSRVWLDILTAGWGGVQKQTRTNPRTGETDIRYVQNEWDRMWWDTHSSAPDFSDARYLGLVKWMDFDDAKALYQSKADQLEHAYDVSSSNNFNDKPDDVWIEKQDRRVRVALCYWREGRSWRWAEFTKGALLKGGESPFTDEDGTPYHPFVWDSAYVDTNNNRYGLVEEMIDPQDEVNKRASKLLHKLNVKQSFGKKSAVGDIAKFKAELAKPDGFLELNEGSEWGKDAGLVQDDADIAGHFQLFQNALQHIEKIGPSMALEGKEQRDLSGVALQTQQQGGLIQLGGLLDTLRTLDKRTYRSMWNGVRQFWTAPKWIRVTDDERNIRFVGLNIPNEFIEQAQQYIEQQGGKASFAQQSVAEMDVDIIIEDAPDVTTLQLEQFQQLVALAPAVTFPPQVYIQAAPNLRNKKQLLDILEQGSQPSPEQQLDMEKTASEIENTRADTQKKLVDAGKTQIDAQKVAVETRRTEVDTARSFAEGVVGPEPKQPANAA